jgi:bacteriocin biosynthesis cyclodehydratase domain-containing protein
MPEASRLTYPVHLLSLGSFGQAVGSYLSALRTDVLETKLAAQVAPSSGAWPTARIRVVAAWRPVQALCRQLDDLSYQNGQPFIPLVLDSTLLQLGPVVVPGCGPCWGCSAQRNRQHATSLAGNAALCEFYDNDWEAGPRGYFEPFALMAAGRVSETIDAIDCATAVPGQVWQIDLLTRKTSTARAIGIDGCPRCGLGRQAATRGFSDLQTQLAYLWAKNVQD